MKPLSLPVLGALLLGWMGASSAQAQAVLRITEVMSNGDVADWFEITNFGNTAANISSYRMDDGSFAIASSVPLNGITTIAPGESVVFIEGTSTNASTLKTNWGLGGSVQIGFYSGSGISFSGSGDGVTIFDASGNELSGPFDGKIRVSFGTHSPVKSFYYRYSPTTGDSLDSGVANTSALGDETGSFTGINGPSSMIGSPGATKPADGLRFTSTPPVFAKTTDSINYTVTFTNQIPPNATLLSNSLGILTKPAWLTLNGSNSGAVLSGIPGAGATGLNNVRLQATSQTRVVQGGVTNNQTTNTVQEFDLRIFPASSPVIVNEYNAVSATSVLDTSQQSKRPGNDSRLGIVSGNGGDWIELVVVGNGTEGSTVNLQGWQIEISDLDGSGARVTDTLTLSASSQWAAVPAGTILTFTENNAATGGFDTGFNLDDQRATAGWTWSNVWMGDTNLISSRVWADGVGLSTLSQNQTQIVLKNSDGVLMQGPCGEGISPAGDGLVTSKKVFALQKDPDPGVVPYDAAYVDSMQSSFGKPNPIVTKSSGRTAGIQAFFGKSPAPFFTVLPLNLAIAGQRYGGEDIFQNNIEIFQVNLNDLTFSARRKNNGGPLPLWLSYEQDFEFVNLKGTPGVTDIGVLELELVAKDNVSNIETIQPLTIQVLSATSPVLLNEYNAVGLTDQLGDGTGSDTFFGLVDGNGGDWFELVVVGSGTAGSTVNLQGWRIEIDDAAGTAFVPDQVIVLSDDAYWGEVQAGTLLTFGDRGTAEGGLDTWIHKVNELGQAAGYAWSHVLVHDPVYVNQTASTFGGGLGISSAGTQFRVVRPDGSVAAGPFGEGLKTLPGVNSTEVFRLATNPHPGITPLDPGYTDSTSSSFGSPNTSQSLAAYQVANSAPVFTNQPTKYAVEGQVYSWTAGTADAENNSVTVSKVSGPTWLNVSGKTLSGTPPQGSAGFYDVALSASDGTASTPLQFRLTVFNDNPAIILNEYNAVDNSGATLAYLNGGSASANGDGSTPGAVDTRFGRVAGNGGDWVEFVVTGNGSAGTTDLRGWTIEIDEGAAYGFTAKIRIKLSDATFWSAVPNGTILTFIEKNTAQGGLDTNLTAADNSTTNGWRWANVWIGDATLVTYTDLATNGYTITAGEVDGINIDNTETQFRVLNSSGYAVFGPAGEGIAPVSGIGATDVLELEGDPTASVLPTDRSDDTATPPKSGYDNSSKGSTFGAPNEWHIGSGGSLTVQNFSAYVSAAGPYDATFGSWASAAGQGSIALNSDADGNGLTALLEYAYGAAAPGSISRSLLPASSTTNDGGTNRLVLTYFTRTSGVTVAPEVNTSLGTNGWGTNGVSNTLVDTVTTNGTTLEQRRASVSIDGGRKFLRLKATSP